MTEKYNWQELCSKLMQSRLVFRRDSVIFDHCSKRYYVSVKGHPERPFIWCLFPQTRDLECFADSNNIPWNPPNIRHPDDTAVAPQMSLLSLCALLLRQSHLFLICVVSTYNDSSIIPRKLAKFPGIVSVNDFWLPRWLQELL